MPALVAGIHLSFLMATKTWMAGTSPAMTDEVEPYFASTYLPSFTVSRMRERSSRP